MSDRLIGCRTKIDRAKQHIRDAETTIRTFLDTKPYVVGTKRNPQTRELIYYLVSVRETPHELAAIAGDALQNLRSALDHLAYQLVFVGTNGNGPFDHVYFPIFDDVVKYEAGKHGRVKGMRSDAISAIDAVKPYRGGDDTLWRLHKLNNSDKHRLLLTVGSAYRSVDIGGHLHRKLVEAFPESSGSPAISLHLRPADRLCPLKAGDELFIDQADAKVDEGLKFTFDIALSEPQVAEGEPLVETVKQMADVIDGLIPHFEPFVK
jgi:hypothetical protein